MPLLLRLILFLIACILTAGPAAAVESVRIPLDAQAIDLTHAIERYGAQGDRIQVSTAPGADGIVRRIEVRARETGTQPNWIVLALTNDTDEQLQRLIVAPHFRLVDSGVVWPDLGATRISAITASQGFSPERQDSDDADVFQLTLDPGTNVTYVAELRTPNLPQIYLWEPNAYKAKVTGFTLYKGIVIGIAGLLALFLTVLFVVRGAVIFPAAAALAWAVLAYVCIDFGFWQKVFPAAAGADRIYRAAAEATLAATLLVFLFAYLNLNRWYVRAAHIGIVWFVFLGALIGLAVYDAPIAAGVARISLATIAGVGLILVIYLATHGFDRAVMLIPTWSLLVIWVTAAGFTVMGSLTNDLVSPALIGGLVLIVMLIGFTVMQNAFMTSGLSAGSVSDAERRALAMTGSGDILFDWNVSNDQIYVSHDMEGQLGLKRGQLEGPASGWLELLHPQDRDRYRACLDFLTEQRCGRIAQDFRLKASDGHYLCFCLKARPVVGPSGEVVRVVGLLGDVTESRTAEERLMHDAVRDSLTGLPNRELFFDRLDTALRLAATGDGGRPMVIAIDLNRFKQINDAIGIAAGDSVLLTVARRLGRIVKPQDTLARVAGDEFAIVLSSEGDLAQAETVAERARKAIATPIVLADREIALSASIGIATSDPAQQQKAPELLSDAEIAMAHAKRGGGNRVEMFRVALRMQQAHRPSLEADLRRALSRDEISVHFEPVVRLHDRTVAGFQARLRWEHPKRGRLPSSEFLALAEDIGVILEIGAFALERTARELSVWQQALEVDPPIFASLKLSSRRFLRQELLSDVRAVLNRSQVLPGSLKLELTESLLMENLEKGGKLLARVKELGAGLALDDFGVGTSSLATLERLPFDTVKIDPSFVRQNGKGTRPVILRSMIALAHDLGMDVVAEGADTESDSIELYQLGCEYAQGFAFGQPMTERDARRLMGAAVEAA